MSGPARVGAFVLVLAAVFAAAAAIGYAVGPLDRGRAPAEPTHAESASRTAPFPDEVHK